MLAAAMIDQTPNAVCLSEPERHTKLMETAGTAEEFVLKLSAEFDAIRKTLLAGGSVFDRRGKGNLPVTNYFEAQTSNGPRRPTYEIVEISRPGMSADFLLVSNTMLCTLVYYPRSREIRDLVSSPSFGIRFPSYYLYDRSNCQ